MATTSAREGGLSVLLRNCVSYISLFCLTPGKKPECLGMVMPICLASKDKREGDALWIPPGLCTVSGKDPVLFFACPEEPRKMGRPLELFRHSRYSRFRIFHEDAQLEDQLLQISHMYSSGNPLTPVISVP